MGLSKKSTNNATAPSAGVIEFNAAWGAGLNGCDPEKVLPAILEASA
jgi:hypothetical protein